jgi:hypothetical protein
MASGTRVRVLNALRGVATASQRHRASDTRCGGW